MTSLAIGPDTEPAAEPNTPVVDEEPTEEPTEEDSPNLSAPALNASRAEWAAYAVSLGLSDTGTRTEIQERVQAALSPAPVEPYPFLSELAEEHLPLSATVGELVGTVHLNRNYIRVFTLSMRGAIGEMSVSITAASIYDVAAVLDALEEQAAALSL